MFPLFSRFFQVFLSMSAIKKPIPYKYEYPCPFLSSLHRENVVFQVKAAVLPPLWFKCKPEIKRKFTVTF